MVGRLCSQSSPACCSLPRRRAGGAAARRPRHRRDGISDARPRICSPIRSSPGSTSCSIRASSTRTGWRFAWPSRPTSRSARSSERAARSESSSTSATRQRSAASTWAASLRAPRQHWARRRRDGPGGTRSGFLPSRSSTRRTTTAPVLLTERFPPLEVVSRINTARLQGLDPDAGRVRRARSSRASRRPTRRTVPGPALLAGLLFVAAFLLRSSRSCSSAACFFGAGEKRGGVARCHRSSVRSRSSIGAPDETTPKTGARRWRHSPPCSSETASVHSPRRPGSSRGRSRRPPANGPVRPEPRRAELSGRRAMALRPDRREPRLPFAELKALRRPLRRTTILRVLLGSALAAVFVAALVVARDRDAQPDGLLPAGRHRHDRPRPVREHRPATGVRRAGAPRCRRGRADRRHRLLRHCLRARARPARPARIWRR